MRTSNPHWLRVLQHLYRYSAADQRMTAPFGTTQPGIGSTLGITRAHAALVLSDLQRRQMVESRLLHISGNRRRCKAYFPTHLGVAALLERGVAS